jgi:lysophospholipid acyltransferase (LPLAT)-like uncharacterized protein
MVVPWYHWLWVAPLALGLRLWLSTLRVTSSTTRFEDTEGPSVIVLWHDRLFLSPLIAQRYLGRPVTALISTSKDGAWLVAFYQLMGLRAVRGSSNRRGTAALVALTRAVRAGSHAGVTPDGPKGPRHAVKAGVVSLAKLTQRPFLLLGINYKSCWRLSSWDRFALPKPFSRVDLVFEVVPTPEAGADEQEVSRRLEQRMNELTVT